MECLAASLPWLNVLTAELRFVPIVGWSVAGIRLRTLLRLSLRAFMRKEACPK